MSTVFIQKLQAAFGNIPNIYFITCNWWSLGDASLKFLLPAYLLECSIRGIGRDDEEELWGHVLFEFLIPGEIDVRKVSTDGLTKIMFYDPQEIEAGTIGSLDYLDQYISGLKTGEMDRFFSKESEKNIWQLTHKNATDAREAKVISPHERAVHWKLTQAQAACISEWIDSFLQSSNGYLRHELNLIYQDGIAEERLSEAKKIQVKGWRELAAGINKEV